MSARLRRQQDMWRRERIIRQISFGPVNEIAAPSMSVRQNLTYRQTLLSSR
jgi:hypothetical protein